MFEFQNLSKLFRLRIFAMAFLRADITSVSITILPLQFMCNVCKSYKRFQFPDPQLAAP